MLFKKTPAPIPAPAPVEPPLEELVAIANRAASAHLTAFSNAATGLEVQADKLDELRDRAATEASRHYAIKVDADTAAFKAREQAQKIRDLIGA